MLFRENNSRADSCWIIFLRIKLNSIFVTTIYFYLGRNSVQFCGIAPNARMDGIAVTKVLWCRRRHMRVSNDRPSGQFGFFVFFLGHRKAELRKQREVGTNTATSGPCVPIILCTVIQIHWVTKFVKLLEQDLNLTCGSVLASTCHEIRIFEKRLMDRQDNMQNLWYYTYLRQHVALIETRNVQSIYSLIPR